MKKVVLIPNAFKGTLSSLEVIEVMSASIRSMDSNCEIIPLPISDGGEGFVDAWLRAKKGIKIDLTTDDPYLRPVQSTYGLLDEGIAIIELATTSGLHLTVDRPDPSIATTRGVGEPILHAINKGAQRIYLGLGGSATNDAGTGLIEGLGFRFYNKDNHLFSPNGSNLSQIARIDDTNVPTSIKEIPISVLSDVTNPLFGPTGAAKVFARQKGANTLMIERLDDELQAYSSFLKKNYNFSTDFEGAGAAGGTPASVLCFLNATLTSGIEAILEAIHFDEQIRTADVVFTGEGRLDAQSLKGKAVYGIASHCHQMQIPCIAIVGQIKGL